MVLSRTRIALTVTVLGAAGAAITNRALASPPATTDALPFPGPNEFVSGLDLECFETPLPNQPINLTVTLTHLNPVLVQLGLPPHNVVIRDLVQTCVPVQKNGVSPSATALPFIQHVDLACFRVEAAPLLNPVTLTLTHLNPVLLAMGLPAHKDRLVQPEQLCVPVMKNNVVPPPEVARLVQFIDLECWKTDAGAHPNFAVSLKQFNPQLGAIPTHVLPLAPQPRQMCVPVRKNNQVIPDAILNIVRWIDLEKFPASQVVTLPSVPVTLGHLNPLFTTLHPLAVKLARANALMVPVAKNGLNPPLP